MDAVLHFAGLKSAPGSLRDPVAYYDVNVGGTICLLRAMHEHGVRQLVFSSERAGSGLASGCPRPGCAPSGRTCAPSPRSAPGCSCPARTPPRREPSERLAGPVRRPPRRS
nr:NAD-dependent epimerase/dehydratase family protein [Streptomyces davaonensis]